MERYLNAVYSTQRLWLPLSLIFSAALAAVLPVQISEVSDLINIIDRWSAVTVAFTSGFFISTNKFLHYARKPRIHLFVVIISLVFIPIFTEITTYLLTVTNVIDSDDFIEGLIITSCMPASFRSVVTLTFDGLGNETSAMISVILCKYLAVVVTPLWITIFLGSAEVSTIRESLWGLNSTLLGPFVLGHAIQRLTDFHNEMVMPFDIAMKVILLFNFYVAASQLSQELEIYRPLEMLTLFITVAITLTVLKLIIAKISDIMELDPESRNSIAITYAATHKSLRSATSSMNKSVISSVA
ncbi:sodium/bile acid cotransporter 7-like [Bacillus rossius redtenbacheri]|uniref:sodium/bile acid cotransporter 7-like n=1 Tax=Bacillus rossius redtenbacheri TaxID=93214 RepID=UPI002FDE86AF